MSILPNVRSMFFERYWSHIQDFLRVYRTDLRELLSAWFPNILAFSMSKMSRFPKWYVSKTIQDFLELVWVVRWFQKMFWGRWTRPPSLKIMELKTSQVFPKWNRSNVTSPKMKQNNSTELSGHSFHEISNKDAMGPQIHIFSCCLCGPPRQATEPPWSGARVGVGILRGFVVSRKSQRFKKMIGRKCQDSTPANFSPKVSTCFSKKHDCSKIQRFRARQN